jgi:dihydroneopterin aldolase
MPSFGWIRLQSLHVDGVRVGIYPHEKDGPQSVVIDIGLYVDLAKAARSEKIKDTVDYDAVATMARELARARYYPLIESLAEGLAAMCLKRFKARKVAVEVKKPGALAPGAVSVQIERSR